MFRKSPTIFTKNVLEDSNKSFRNLQKYFRIFYKTLTIQIQKNIIKNMKNMKKFRKKEKKMKPEQ